MILPSIVFAVLSETSLFPILWQILRRREIALLDVHPHLPWFERPLRAIARWLLGKKLLKPAHERFICIEHLYRLPSFVGQTEMFLTIEPWINEYFQFDALDRSGTPYANAIKQTAWLHSEHLCNTAFALNELRRAGAWDNAKLVGITPEMAGIVEAYGGCAPPGAPISAFTWARRIINVGLLAALVLYTIGWTLRRIRLRKITRQSYLLGSTLALDRRLFKNLSDIPDSRDQVCIVYVLRSHMEAAMRELDSTGITFRHIGEGRMTPAQACGWLLEILTDYVRLWRGLAGYWPMVFFQSVKLAHHRLAYRALFNRYRFSYFWGRDDHDQAHQMRTQELRRVGCVSMGINHGIPVSDILQPGNRYLDFDHYYVFGRAFYERYYKHTWPAHMTVTAIGSFGLSRDELHRIAVPRTKDIVMFANPTLDNDSLLDTALSLAREFPDRHVFFKTKQAPKDVFFVELLKTRHSVPPNFEFVQKSSEATYDMLMWCGYSIANISTLGVESIHFGLRTFIFDTQPPNCPLYYRDFDRLTFRDVKEVVARIRDLEAGRDIYPWAAYDGIADASGQDPFDRVRADMGLPPKSPGGKIAALRLTREAPIDLADTFHRQDETRTETRCLISNQA